MRNIVVTN